MFYTWSSDFRQYLEIKLDDFKTSRGTKVHELDSAELFENIKIFLNRAPNCTAIEAASKYVSFLESQVDQYLTVHRKYQNLLNSIESLELFQVSCALGRITIVKIVCSGIAALRDNLDQDKKLVNMDIRPKRRFPDSIKTVLKSIIDAGDVPSLRQREELTKKSGLSLKQINTWIWTYRSRSRKMSVDDENDQWQFDHLNLTALIQDTRMEDPYLQYFYSDNEDQGWL